MSDMIKLRYVGDGKVNVWGVRGRKAWTNGVEKGAVLEFTESNAKHKLKNEGHMWEEVKPPKTTTKTKKEDE